MIPTPANGQRHTEPAAPPRQSGHHAPFHKSSPSPRTGQWILSPALNLTDVPVITAQRPAAGGRRRHFLPVVRSIIRRTHPWISQQSSRDSSPISPSSPVADGFVRTGCSADAASDHRSRFGRPAGTGTAARDPCDRRRHVRTVRRHPRPSPGRRRPGNGVFNRHSGTRSPCSARLAPSPPARTAGDSRKRTAAVRCLRTASGMGDRLRRSAHQRSSSRSRARPPGHILGTASGSVSEAASSRRAGPRRRSRHLETPQPVPALNAPLRPRSRSSAARIPASFSPSAVAPVSPLRQSIRSPRRTGVPRGRPAWQEPASGRRHRPEAE